MNRKLMLLWIFLSGILLVSCSKDLSRDKAAEILSTIKYGYSEGSIPSAYEKSIQMSVGECSQLIDYPEQRAKEEQEYKEWKSSIIPYLDKLKSEGLITYELWEGPQGVRPPGSNPAQASIVDCAYRFNKISVNPTEKLNPYIISTDRFSGIRVRLVDFVFDKITGIQKNSDTDVIVEFTVKPAPTPLNNLVKANNNNFQQSRSASFRKYDDGWRLVQ